MLVVRVGVALRVRRSAVALLSANFLVLFGFFLWPPAGAHDVSAKRKQLSAL